MRYAVAGGMVTLVNAWGYLLFLEIGLVYTTANLISLILSKVTGYVLNKFWVYRTGCESIRQVLGELLRFVFARGFTGVLDYVGVIILVEFIGAGERISKLIVMGIVIIVNYILGKWLVFRKRQ